MALHSWRSGRARATIGWAGGVASSVRPPSTPMNTTVETPASDAASEIPLEALGHRLPPARRRRLRASIASAPARRPKARSTQGRGGGPGGFGGGRGGGRRRRSAAARSCRSASSRPRKQNLDVYLRALGTVTPINTVTVRTAPRRRAGQGELHRGPARRQGPGAGRDRHAPLPGAAVAGAGRARREPGPAAQRRRPTSSATRSCSRNS